MRTKKEIWAEIETSLIACEARLKAVPVEDLEKFCKAIKRATNKLTKAVAGSEGTKP